MNAFLPFAEALVVARSVGLPHRFKGREAGEAVLIAIECNNICKINPAYQLAFSETRAREGLKNAGQAKGHSCSTTASQPAQTSPGLATREGFFARPKR